MSKLNTIDSWMDKFGSFYGDGVAAYALQKADAPMLTTTSGMFNAIHGAKAFFSGNNEANAWNILPKEPHVKSGFRLRTARGFTLATGGVADGGAVADTVKSTVVEVTAKPKLSQLTFEIGTMTDLLDGDDRYTFEEERVAKGEDHIMDIDAQLLTDVDTPASANFESIDRVCSSQAETAITSAATDPDIYGLDRSASTAYDAYVDHNSGTDRALTTAMIRTAITTIKQNSGKVPNVILTGYDTYEKIIALYESQARYMTESRVSVGVNGVQSMPGGDVGLSVSAIMGIPVLLDSNVVTDTISRVYFLNTNFLKLSIAQPTQLTVSDNVLDRGVFTKKGLYLTIGELWCTQFSAQGKIRDLL